MRADGCAYAQFGRPEARPIAKKIYSALAGARRPMMVGDDVRRLAIGGRLEHPLVAENGGHCSGWEWSSS